MDVWADILCTGFYPEVFGVSEGEKAGCVDFVSFPFACFLGFGFGVRLSDFCGRCVLRSKDPYVNPPVAGSLSGVGKAKVG